MNSRVLAIVAAIGLFGCSTPAQLFEVNNTRSFAAPKEVVWDRLIRYFATNNIQIKTLEKASGVIYAEREMSGAATSWWERGKVGDMADCGKDFGSIPESQTIQLNVYVRELGPAQSQATVTVTFKELYNQRVGFGGAPKACNSTGVLETKVLDTLAVP